MIVHLVVIVIHEDPYIAEFLDHYIGLGVDRIYLYDNSPSATMSVLTEHPRVAYKHFPGAKKQLPAYTDYIQNSQDGTFESADFVGFMDADEFVILKRHNSIQEFLEDFVDVSGVGLAWRMFGTNGLVSYDHRPVVERFPIGEVEIDSHFKSFVRPRDIILPVYDPHYFVTQKGTTTASHTKMMKGSLEHTEEKGDVAIIHHYFTKSFGEFMKKCVRGRSDNGQSRSPVEVFSYDYSSKNPDKIYV
jgi:hypothetical protein